MFLFWLPKQLFLTDFTYGSVVNSMVSESNDPSSSPVNCQNLEQNVGLYYKFK